MKDPLTVLAVIAVTVGLAVGAALAISAAAGNDGPAQVRSEDDAGPGDALGVCVEGVPDCVDTIVCTEESPCDHPDPSYKCAEDGYDCDEPVSGEPITIIDDQDPNECSFVHNIDACEKQAAEAALSDLSARLDVERAAIVVVSTEFTDWPNSCLGVAEPNQVCLQVITPGFKIVLEHSGTSYEYHTDATGSAFVLID